jgi:hypothetical protein
MGEPGGGSNQVWIERVAGMLTKELRIRGEQAGIQDLQDTRQIDFGILGIGMIAMDTQGGGAEECEAG